MGSTPQPQRKANLYAAAKGNVAALLQALLSFEARMTALERRAPTLTPPPLAKLAVSSPAPGSVVVAITNPQFSAGKPGNPLGNLMFHQLSYSTDPGFSRGVITLPITSQNHFVIPNNGTIWVKVKSSFTNDGKNFNTESQAMAVSS